MALGSDDVPALLVRAAAWQLREPAAIERFGEEWLASLPRRSRLRRWRYALSLLTCGARSTATALRQPPARAQTPRLVLLYGAFTIMAGIGWEAYAVNPTASQMLLELLTISQWCLLIATIAVISVRRRRSLLTLAGAVIAGLLLESTSRILLYRGPCFDAGLLYYSSQHPVGWSVVTSGITTGTVVAAVVLALDPAAAPAHRALARVAAGTMALLYGMNFDFLTAWDHPTWWNTMWRFLPVRQPWTYVWGESVRTFYIGDAIAQVIGFVAFAVIVIWIGRVLRILTAVLVASQGRSAGDSPGAAWYRTRLAAKAAPVRGAKS